MHNSGGEKDKMKISMKTLVALILTIFALASFGAERLVLAEYFTNVQ